MIFPIIHYIFVYMANEKTKSWQKRKIHGKKQEMKFYWNGQLPVDVPGWSILYDRPNRNEREMKREPIE